MPNNRFHVVPLAEVCVLLGMLFVIAVSDALLVIGSDWLYRGTSPASSLARIHHEERLRSGLRRTFGPTRATFDILAEKLVSDEAREAPMG